MDRYHVLELIGEGQFGKVYKGRRKFGSQTVALKFIGKKGKSDKQLSSLRQEMHILESLTSCPYVIRMLDWFETPSEICVVTEFAQGELFEILEDDSSLPEDTVRDVAIQLVEGLRYLHANRIIHRDMKPQNILIGGNATLKICDFGFARSMSPNTSLLTSICGTPLYMSPELVRSMPYSHTVDCWSLGVILYELAVGTPPFFTNSFYTLVHLIVDTDVEYPANMSATLRSFLEGLLQKQPSKRLTWPELANHPFVRETEEQRATRIAKHTGNQAIRAEQARTHSNDAPLRRVGAGLGGAAMPGNNSSNGQQQATRGTAAGAVVSSIATTLTASSSASSTPSNTSSSNSISTTTDSSGGDSTDLNLQDLSLLLSSPQHAHSLPHTLQQLTTTLQRAASSSQLPSPLLDVYPTLLAQQVPAQLCRILVTAYSSSSSSSSSSTLDYASLFPLVLQALVAMLHPSGGAVKPMPLYAAAADGSDGSSALANAGAAAAAAGGGAARASMRAAAGRAPPNLDLQLRRQLAECICAPVEQGGGGGGGGVEGGGPALSAFDLLSKATRAACKETTVALAKRGEPTAALSSLVIVLFQCTRSRVATSSSSSSGAPPATPAAGGASASGSVASGGLLDCLSRDIPLLSALWSTLHACASGLSGDNAAGSSSRSRAAGRLLLFFASLCGKHPSVVKLLVSQCGFEGAAIVALLSPATSSSMIALPAAFLLSQLLTNPHARLEQHVHDPMPLLRTATHWLQTPAAGAYASATLLVELEGSGVGYSLLGSHDGLLQLLQALVYFHSLQASTPAAALISRDALPTSEHFLTHDVWTLLLQRLERLEQPSAPPQASPSKQNAAAVVPAAHAADPHACAELSVLGWMSLLSLLLDLLKLHARLTSTRSATAPSARGEAHPSQSAGAVDTERLLSDSLFRGVCALLSGPRVAALYGWPEACGGGSVGVGLLLKRTLGVLYVPFTFRGVSDHLLARAQKSLFNLAVVRRLLVASRLLELPAQMEPPLGFLAHLTMRHANFEKQLLEQGGLQLLTAKQILNPNSRTAMVPAPAGSSHAAAAGGGGGNVGGAPQLVKVQVAPSVALLIDALNIVSHLARSSAAHYPAIHAAGLYGDLKSLLHHPDSSVRSKTCNVLGNLCRHSAFFYPHLASNGVLPPLVERCSDADAQVRKWAAFALGNAVFHDASLCAQASAAIPALLQLLRAKDEHSGGGSGSSGSDRTAQNAAGVLTNMLRHGVAAHEMIEQGAVHALVALLEEACSTAGGAPQSAQQVASARSAMFTLGDLAVFRSARSKLQQSGALERLQRLQQDSSDAKLHTYWQRLLTRYNGPAQG